MTNYDELSQRHIREVAELIRQKMLKMGVEMLDNDEGRSCKDLQLYIMDLRPAFLHETPIMSFVHTREMYNKSLIVMHPTFIPELCENLENDLLADFLKPVKNRIENFEIIFMRMSPQYIIEIFNSNFMTIPLTGSEEAKSHENVEKISNYLISKLLIPYGELKKIK